MKYENIWFVGNTKIIDTIIINGLTLSISQRIEQAPTEISVTHGKFFGENIKRAIHTFKRR